MLLCTFGNDCDCQAPKGCKNAMCSDHCTGCMIHKVVVKKEPKATQVKAAPIVVPEVNCIAYKDCIHVFQLLFVTYIYYSIRLLVENACI